MKTKNKKVKKKKIRKLSNQANDRHSTESTNESKAHYTPRAHTELMIIVKENVMYRKQCPAFNIINSAEGHTRLTTFTIQKSPKRQLLSRV